MARFVGRSMYVTGQYLVPHPKIEGVLNALVDIVCHLLGDVQVQQL